MACVPQSMCQVTGEPLEAAKARARYTSVAGVHHGPTPGRGSQDPLSSWTPNVPGQGLG